MLPVDMNSFRTGPSMGRATNSICFTFSPDRLPHYDRVFRQTVSDQIDRYEDLPKHNHMDDVNKGKIIKEIQEEKLKKIENLQLMTRSVGDEFAQPVSKHCALHFNIVTC